jgi:hypothetical protein
MTVWFHLAGRWAGNEKTGRAHMGRGRLVFILVTPEESAFRLLEARRDTPGWPPPARFAAARMARAAASGLEQAESRFLGPATRGAFVWWQCGRASE